MGAGEGTFYDEDTRWLAAIAVLHTLQNGEPDFHAALPVFRDHCHAANKEVPHDCNDFLQRWWGRYDTSPNKVGCMHDLEGRGSRTHVDPALVDEAAAHFAMGYMSEAQIHKHWPNFEMALRYDVRLKLLLDSSGVTPRTFFTHILEVCGWAALPTGAARSHPAQAQQQLGNASAIPGNATLPAAAAPHAHLSDGGGQI